MCLSSWNRAWAPQKLSPETIPSSETYVDSTSFLMAGSVRALSRACLVPKRRSQVQEHPAARQLGRRVADQLPEHAGQVRLVVVARTGDHVRDRRPRAQQPRRVPRPLDQLQLAARQADGPHEPALRGPLRQAAYRATVLQLLD